MGRLKRVDRAMPGIARKRAGKGFTYVDAAGRRVTDPATLERVRALVIPPAWRDVWICPEVNGHIQATGVDAKGRRQYRYHDAWRLRRDREKFEHMVDFGRRLPRVRRRLVKDMRADETLTQRKVLACAVRLLDLGFFRIGTEGYAEENETYGIATMLRSHVKLNGNVITFDYSAKGGKQRIQSVVDPDVFEIVAELKRRRGGGGELLAWRDAHRWVDVRSQDINDYIKRIARGDFTAKDFRTWNATLLAAVAVAVSRLTSSVSSRKRAIARAMTEVGHYLGNTPAVARSSYVDPRVIDRFMDGDTIAASLTHLGVVAEFGQPSTQGAIERAVLELLDPGGEEEQVAS